MKKITRLHNILKKKSKIYWYVREAYVVFRLKLYSFVDSPKKVARKKILFYHINSLSHAGTEKFLQILAKYLDKNKFDVYYLYPRKNNEGSIELSSRYKYLEISGVKLIPFEYEKVAKKPPYFVFGMNPNIKELIRGLGIDLLILPSPGAADYPFSMLKNIPIFLLNIFGQPSLQKNISYHLCISKEVADKISLIVNPKKIEVFPIPSEDISSETKITGQALREKFNISDSTTVFGRIGRDSNDIHDSIGIEAFKIAQKINPNIAYLIMSPPPILVEQVQREKIPNVYFIPPSSDEKKIWGFHAAIDALAHFRKDGESFGLNIVESMLASKPIISHKSHIWNAHLEYLGGDFCRIADKDDCNTYAKFMLEFADLKKQEKLGKLGELARAKAEKEFLIDNLIGRFEDMVNKAIEK